MFILLGILIVGVTGALLVKTFKWYKAKRLRDKLEDVDRSDE